MDIRNLPIIKFEIEGIRSTIAAQLGVRNSEFGDVLQQEIEKAVADYPFEAKVREIVYSCMTQSIQNYFSYGEGAKAIKQSVSDIFEKEK